MLKRADEVIASGDERAAVDFAISVNRQVSKGKRELDQIKAHLRKLGIDKLAQKDPRVDGVTLEGNIGDAYIQFPPDEPRPVRGQDLRDVEANVSRQTFMLLFTKTTVVKPAKDFIERLDDIDPTERAIVERFVAVHTPTGKVNLPK